MNKVSLGLKAHCICTVYPACSVQSPVMAGIFPVEYIVIAHVGDAETETDCCELYVWRGTKNKSSTFTSSMSLYYTEDHYVFKSYGSCLNQWYCLQKYTKHTQYTQQRWLNSSSSSSSSNVVPRTDSIIAQTGDQAIYGYRRSRIYPLFMWLFSGYCCLVLIL